MQLKDAHALLERSFAGVTEGAARLVEPADSRFEKRPSAVWLEYRWYVHGRGLAEVFLKWGRVSPEQSPRSEATVLRIHLLGKSPELLGRARRVLEGGTPAPERILDVVAGDGLRRECVSFGRTTVTVEQWEPVGPRALLEEHGFQTLAGTLESPRSTPEERHEAVQRLAHERSARVEAALLELVERKPSLMALRILSEWGVVRARGPLQRDLAEVRPDNPADLWALTALDRRLEAWEAVAQYAYEDESVK